MSNFVLWAAGALSAAFLSAFPFGSNTIQKGLGASLSQHAELYLPGSDGFASASARWSAAAVPRFEAIVEVKTEKDVEHTIKYANKYKKPFLAISGGHGTFSALNDVQNGIGIFLRGMDKIEIVADGTAALIGGGVQNGKLICELWSHGKQTVTTGCDCVGFIAPVLGGGHGWLQGRYGLPADQLLSARMVLANGSAITVSETQHPDLFWAIRGAGQNFGVVTEIKVKVYDREPEQDQWAASGFVFTQERMEAVFAVANQWLESPNRPAELIHYGVFAFSPDVDAKNPLVILWVYYQGASIPTQFTDPLYALQPIAVDTSVTDLAGVNTHLMANVDGASCAKGFTRLFGPVSLQTYSLPNLRTVLDKFAALPPDFHSSVVMLEGYPTNRVTQIPSNSTAFPDREGQLLVTPLLTYAANKSLDEEGFAIAEGMRTALLQGTGLKLNAYVNYARGNEALEAIYGYEDWRLEKLRALKQEYDPFGKFNFYAPITRAKR